MMEESKEEKEKKLLKLHFDELNISRF